MTTGKNKGVEKMEWIKEELQKPTNDKQKLVLTDCIGYYRVASYDIDDDVWVDLDDYPLSVDYWIDLPDAPKEWYNK